MKLIDVIPDDDLPQTIKQALSNDRTAGRIKAKLLNAVERRKNNPLPSKKTKMNSFIDTFGNLGDDSAHTDQGRVMDPASR